MWMTASSLRRIEPGHQLGRRHQIGDLMLGEVAPFGVVVAEQVVDDDVGGARLVEARHHVRPDEAGPAGDQKHIDPLRGQPLPQSGGARKWDRVKACKCLRKG